MQEANVDVELDADAIASFAEILLTVKEKNDSIDSVVGLINPRYITVSSFKNYSINFLHAYECSKHIVHL